MSTENSRYRIKAAGRAEAIRVLLLQCGVSQFTKLDNLLRYFVHHYPEAPGSSGNHQAWPAGYYDHVFDCLLNAVKLHKLLDPPVKLHDVAYVLFLHDIEKPIKYCDSNYVAGRPDNAIRQSLMEDFDIKPNELQLNALKYIHGEGHEYSKSNRVMSELAAFCHCCDVISARIFHSTDN